MDVATTADISEGLEELLEELRAKRFGKSDLKDDDE